MKQSAGTRSDIAMAGPPIIAGRGSRKSKLVLIAPPVTQPVEYRHAIVIASDSFAIDDAGDA
jgi:hypothetical protein